MQKYYCFIAVVILSVTVIAQINRKKEADNGPARPEIKNSAPDAIAINNRGVGNGLGGRYEEAVGDFRKAVALDPERLEFRYNLGRALLKTGGESEAIEIFRHLVSVKKDFRDAYAGLGDALSLTGKVEEGIDAYREALRLKRDDAVTLCSLGHSLEQLKKHNEALAALNEAVRLDPALAEARSNRGVTLFSMGRVKDAAAEFRTALSLAPGSAEINGNLGVALDRLGKKEAHRYFAEAARLRPDWGFAIYNLGVSNLKRGERDAARTQLASLERLDVNLAESLKKQLWQKYVVEAPREPAGNAFRP